MYHHLLDLQGCPFCSKYGKMGGLASHAALRHCSYAVSAQPLAAQLVV